METKSVLLQERRTSMNDGNDGASQHFSVTHKVPEARAKDLICCGMESGSYGSFTIVGYDPENIQDNPECAYPHIDAPFLGGAVMLRDKYGDSPDVYRLDRAAIQKGFNVMATKAPHLLSDFLQENEDVVTGDAFLQCALLGDVVYG